MCKYCEGYKLIHEGDNLNVEQNNGIIIIHTNSGSDQHNPNYCYNCGRDLRIRPPKENTFTLKCNKCGSSIFTSCTLGRWKVDNSKKLF